MFYSVTCTFLFLSLNINEPRRTDYVGEGRRDYCRSGSGCARFPGSAETWREFFHGVAARGGAGIELTAGRAAKGYKRLPVEKYAKIIAVRAENPKATQEEVAREAGVSRPTVSRVTRGHSRRAAVSPAV
jgi:hypothetical protein